MEAQAYPLFILTNGGLVSVSLQVRLSVGSNFFAEMKLLPLSLGILKPEVSATQYPIYDLLVPTKAQHRSNNKSGILALW